MILYHGSKDKITSPIYHGSSPSNDYGPAFYLTNDLESAKSWACKNNSVGLVNKYIVGNKKLKNLNVLDLTDKTKYSVLNWIAILMHFRVLNKSFTQNNEIILNWLSKYYIDVNKFDVIIGYTADDAYFRFPISFINGFLSYDDLENIYMLGNLGIQYAFISKKAIDSLKFREVIKCDKKYMQHHFSIVEEATKKFNQILNIHRDPKKKYIFDLIREDF